MSRSSKIFWILVGGTTALVGVFLWRLPRPTIHTSAGVKNPIKIGGLLPLTGDNASLGIPVARSMDLAAQEINVLGGIGGRTLQIVSEDSGCDSTHGATAMTDLISTSRVKYIVGGLCDADTLAASVLAESSKVILISPSATASEIRSLGTFVFRTVPSSSETGKAAANYSYKIGGRTAAVVVQDKESLRVLQKAFTTEFKSLGGETILEEAYKIDTPFKPLVTKIKKAKPDLLILIPDEPASAIRFLEEIKNQKISLKTIVPTATFPNDNTKGSKEATEGLIHITPYFNPRDGATARFLNAYKTKYNEDAPSSLAMAHAYSAIYLLKEALEKVGNNPIKVRDYLSTLSNWRGALGTITFNKNGDPIPKFSVQQILRGDVKEIDAIAQ